MHLAGLADILFPQMVEIGQRPCGPCPSSPVIAALAHGLMLCLSVMAKQGLPGRPIELTNLALIMASGVVVMLL